CWSETMVLQPAIEGMLGLSPDAMKNTLRLAPYFPWDWKTTKVKNIRMGTGKLEMDMQRQENETTYTFLANQPLSIQFEPRFPLGTMIRQVLVNGKPIPFECHPNAEGISLHALFNAVKGRTLVVIHQEGGIGALPMVVLPVPGDISHGGKILSEHLQDGHYTLEMEGPQGSACSFNLVSSKVPQAIEGAQLLSSKENVYTFQVNLPANVAEKYTRKTVKLVYIK
ncbi:MAG: hypothetical protein ACXVBR_12940, partial [Flavisolibacter sp.]